MLFNSYVFIILFLPIVWCIYFLLNRFRFYKLAQAALIVASFVFYGYQDYKLCWLLFATIVGNYTLHLVLINLEKSMIKKIVLLFGVFLNLSLLFYFKYLNFAWETICKLTGQDFVMQNIVLPLGISFFTFQQISMLVDSSKPGMVKYGVIDYALFVSFFPQLVAGPIVLHQEMIPQFHDEQKRKIHFGNLTTGLEYFIFGFAKKVLVADSFARVCDWGYGNVAQLNAYSTVLTILAYTLQVYFDFSGYCDMAKGLGKLFNIEIPINFYSPYKALNIAEFWKRWHITLTRFLTQYLYIPLGGNRKGKYRTYINTMVVFCLSGLWHGADWTFMMWGMLHGAMQVLYRIGKNTFDKLPKWIQWASTYMFVNIAWVFFRAEFSKQPFYLLQRLFVGGGGLCVDILLTEFCSGFSGLVLLERMISGEALAVVQQIWILVWFGLWIFVCVKMPSSHEIVEKKKRTMPYFFALGMLFVWAFSWLSQVSKFIYFNF